MFTFSTRGRKVLESRSLCDDERIDSLEKAVKDAKYVAEEADRKYDEVKSGMQHEIDYPPWFVDHVPMIVLQIQ